MAKKDTAPDFFWLEPLRELLEQSGDTHPIYLYWKRVIGGSQGQSLFDTNEFCALAEPFAPEWTIENFIIHGPGQVLRYWAEREAHRRFCDGGGGSA